MPSWEWRARAKRAFLEGDMAAAAGYMQRAEQEAQNSPNPPKDWRACAYVWTWRGDIDRARQCWHNAANNPVDVSNNIKVRNTVKLARGWLRIFNDADRAIQCINGLQPAEVQNAKRVTNLLKHATGWLRTLFGDDTEAQRFFGVLQPADFENAIEYASVWLNLLPDPDAARRRFEMLQPTDFTNAVEHARIWLQNFDYRPRAELSLESAEQMAAGLEPLLKCAHAWVNLLQNEGRAEICIRKAERFVGSEREWEMCAQVWSDDLHNDREARRCRDEAPRLEFQREARAAAVAGNLNHVVEVFRRYINRLNNAEGARNCLREAQQACQQPVDYVTFAEAWKQCECEEDARQCLLSGQRLLFEQGVGSSIADWCRFAGQWLTLLNNVNAARDCLQQTEDRRHSAGDWIDCARLWKRINDIPHVERCLKQAQKWRALSDLLRCARAWRELTGNQERTGRCLERAEAQAARTNNNTRRWLDVGEQWWELLVDRVAAYCSASRCFRQAEQVADGPGDLLNCAGDWQRINEYATEGIRCLDGAKTFCQTASDWRELATLCRNLLGDEVEAQRCLEQVADLED